MTYICLMVYPAEIRQTNAVVYSALISTHPSRVLRQHCHSGGESPQKAKISPVLSKRRARDQCPSLCSLKNVNVLSVRVPESPEKNNLMSLFLPNVSDKRNAKTNP